MKCEPIDTMPKDMDVLVYHESDGWERRYRPSDRVDSLYPGGSSIDWFTHWMWLPDKPKKITKPKIIT